MNDTLTDLTETVESQARTLLGYWEQHGDDPETVTKWAVSDLLEFVRLVLGNEEPDTSPKPGDRCQILDGFKVRHYDCDEHPNGTVTDVRTGRVVGSR